MSRPLIPVLSGTIAMLALAFIGARVSGHAITDELTQKAQTVIAKAGGASITASFTNRSGMPSRHALLRGGDRLDDATRERVARAVAVIPGVGGVRWAESTALTTRNTDSGPPVHCEDEVEALLISRTIRFEEGSARIDATSNGLVGEVADALRPCLGSIIAIKGHTDTSGPEAGNLKLSRERASAVMVALIRRGIPADGLRASGRGSLEPVEGLDPGDPANRRIEFSVIESVPLKPTPVDTPGPR